MAIYIVLALKEIYNSNRVNLIEKIMWTISFIGLGWIAGLIYLLFTRKRILRKYKILFNDTESFA
jgi:predicted ferric reductase